MTGAGSSLQKLPGILFHDRVLVFVFQVRSDKPWCSNIVLKIEWLIFPVVNIVFKIRGLFIFWSSHFALEQIVDQNPSLCQLLSNVLDVFGQFNHFIPIVIVNEEIFCCNTVSLFVGNYKVFLYSRWTLGFGRWRHLLIFFNSKFSLFHTLKFDANVSISELFTSGLGSSRIKLLFTMLQFSHRLFWDFLFKLDTWKFLKKSIFFKELIFRKAFFFVHTLNYHIVKLIEFVILQILIYIMVIWRYIRIKILLFWAVFWKILLIVLNFNIFFYIKF